MSYPSVFIIIINWNGLEDTLECLSSVTNLSYPNFKIVVVDNGSSDNSVQIIRKNYSHVILIENRENLGYTGGNNIGMCYAMAQGADYCWLLNNDTVVQKNSLSLLVETAEKNSRVGLISPILYHYDKPDSVQFCGSYAEPMNFNIVKIHDPEKLSSLTEKDIILWGTALLIKASVIKKIGLLDDKYFAYHEDCEYCMRAAQYGLISIVEPQAIVYHKGSRSTGDRYSPMQCFLRMRNLWFLWADGLTGIKKLRYLRYFLGDVLSTVAGLINENLNEAADATLNGVWAALHQRGGPFSCEMNSPHWFKRTIYFFVKHHPYFWKYILRGNFSGILLEAFQRIKLRVNSYEQ